MAELSLGGSGTGAVKVTSGTKVEHMVLDEMVGEVNVPEKWMRLGQVTHDDSGFVPLYTVPAGYVLLITRAALEVTEVWDGTGADVDVGVQGVDEDGLIDGSVSGVDFASTGVWPALDSGQGTLLYNNSSKAIVRGVATNAIRASVTPGTGATTGKANVLVKGALFPTT